MTECSKIDEDLCEKYWEKSPSNSAQPNIIRGIGVNNRLKSFVSFVYRRLQDPPRIPTPPRACFQTQRSPPAPLKKGGERVFKSPFLRGI